jgi:murein L,D-transpeptidase YafK
MSRLFVVALGLMVGASLVGGNPARANLGFEEQTKADLVVVYKSERVLELKRGGHVLRAFPIALGREPSGPKRQEGDGRTPEGVYTLDWRNPSSQFHRALHISYPRPADAVHAQRWGVSPGGQIMLHGLPNGMVAEEVGHPQRDWTEGCIALTNEEIEEIWARVEDGTTIIIYP